MYRWFLTSSGKLVIAGKNSKQNEELMKNVKETDVVLHTEAPGSPFCIIKNPEEKDLKEAAIFCACFSQEWKRRKKETIVHIFKGNQIFKDKTMKEGTFGIRGKVKKKRVKLKLTLCFQENKLRAVPISCLKVYGKGIPKIILEPGKIKKEIIVEIIKKRLEDNGIKINAEEILQALPSGGFSIR
ncbi:MAG: DUF814 domain-containing protein [Candidatus Pacearchaeota archaeon]|nr:DUF814 domain-containing protein [Candidatus Pacearchaeota archaeon]